ncbi:MAG: type IV pili methyl-accepting chemotaxis transducer N-terminal domain-containing protein [Burkholderiales bacterium]|nr:type IV pili methyl-accepting chemotaxis transducer N-terminal domain-containing protein [Burkholderiales bacterium]
MNPSIPRTFVGPHWAARLAALLLGACVSVSWAQSKKAPVVKFDAASALNKAVRQPMLAERITKSFTLVGQRVLETRSKRQLEDAVKEFEQALKDLQATAPTPEIKDNYQLLEQLFDEFRNITAKPVSLQNAKDLAEQNEELVWISTKGALLLQAHTKSARSDLIVIAGELRTLTQRIAKLYLFRSWGIRSDVLANDLKKAEADYRADIAKLLAAPQNTEQIKSELALAETQYLFLRQSIERLNANKSSTTELEHVTKACDNILEVMERVTKLYEGIKA